MDEPAKPQIFISHSARDRDLAYTVCDAIEKQNFSCWIAPRDVIGGGLWRVEVLEAVAASRVVVLILSSNSNISEEVWAEIEVARTRKIPIVPFRIEDVSLSAVLELALAGRHRLDAFPQPIETYLGRLIDSVRRQASGLSQAGAYLIQRVSQSDYNDRPGGHWEENVGVRTVEQLRNELIQDKRELRTPEEVRVRGTLYPCALLSSGWWEHRGAKTHQLEWRDGLQGWLFHGFDEWGPSWDFTWDFDNWQKSKDKPYFIAQLGMGDEANSLPVLLPADKAKSLQDRFERGWGGLEVIVRGVLGHRKHFAEHVDPGALELFGGLLDYCLWVDEGKKEHKVTRVPEPTDLYSGYLWKCVAPKKFIVDGRPKLEDVYFIWEHANFANQAAIEYCLESMNHKEEFIQKKHGELVLIQKSSALVKGTPTLSAETVYGIFLSKLGEDID